MFSPDRPEALRRAVEGHRGAGLHRAGRLRRGAGRRCPTASGSPTPSPSREERYRLAVVQPGQDRRSSSSWSRSTRGEPTLVIGQYLDQLDELGRAPRRARHHGRDAGQGARSGCSRRSATGEIDAAGGLARSRTSPSTCPRPSVAIQVSGTFGSRQEEAQRLGRVLRPKARRPHRALLHGRRPRHRRPEFAAHRQRFLAEQGYAYRSSTPTTSATSRPDPPEPGDRAPIPATREGWRSAASPHRDPADCHPSRMGSAPLPLRSRR